MAAPAGGVEGAVLLVAVRADVVACLGAGVGSGWGEGAPGGGVSDEDGDEVAVHGGGVDVELSSEDAVAVADLSQPSCVAGAGERAVDDGYVALEATASQGRKAVGCGEGEVSCGVEEEDVAGGREMLDGSNADRHAGGVARLPQLGDRRRGGSLGVQVLVDEGRREQDLGCERVAGCILQEEATVGFPAKGLHEGEAVLLQVVAQFVQGGEVPPCTAGGRGDGQVGWRAEVVRSGDAAPLFRQILVDLQDGQLGPGSQLREGALC